MWSCQQASTAVHVLHLYDTARKHARADIGGVKCYAIVCACSRRCSLPSRRWSVRTMGPSAPFPSAPADAAFDQDSWMRRVGDNDRDQAAFAAVCRLWRRVSSTTSTAQPQLPVRVLLACSRRKGVNIMYVRACLAGDHLIRFHVSIQSQLCWYVKLDRHSACSPARAGRMTWMASMGKASTP